MPGKIKADGIKFMRKPVHGRPWVSAWQHRAFGHFRFAEKVFLLGFSLVLGNIRLAQQHVHTRAQTRSIRLKAIQRTGCNEVFQQFSVQPKPARSTCKIEHIVERSHPLYG